MSSTAISAPDDPLTASSSSSIAFHSASDDIHASRWGIIGFCVLIGVGVTLIALAAVFRYRKSRLASNLATEADSGGVEIVSPALQPQSPSVAPALPLAPSPHHTIIVPGSEYTTGSNARQSAKRPAHLTLATLDI